MEAILAIDTKNGLAKDGGIPWKSKKDMNFFYNKQCNHYGEKYLFVAPCRK